jgi:hypothetical protein
MSVASPCRTRSRAHGPQTVRVCRLALCAALLVACSVDERGVSVLDPEDAANTLLPNTGGSSAQVADPADPGNTNSAEAPPGAVPLNPSDSNPPLPSSGAAGAQAQPPPGVPVAEQRTLELSGGGSASFGRVRSTPAGLDCATPPCRANFPVGTTVTLAAYSAPTGLEGFAGWSGACTGLDDCTVTVTENVLVSASYGPANRAFVTSTLSDGNLGGIAGADARCVELARQVGIQGDVRAWLSTSSVDAIERLQGSRGWVRMDGKPFVDTPTELQVGNIFHPMRIDEQRRDVDTEVRVHTGSGPGGTFTAACEDWTSNAPISSNNGNANGTGTGFSYAGSALCTVPRHLYCFEVGKSVRVAPAPVAGRLAFIGSASLDRGLAFADAACQRQSAIVSQPGPTFKALLATIGASPASRFDLGGLPWVRPDGVPIAASAAAFFQPDGWDSAPNLDRRGAVSDSAIVVGGTSLLEPGTSEDTCANWTSTADTTPLLQGRSQSADPFGFFYGYESITCAPAVHGMLCLQE